MGLRGLKNTDSLDMGTRAMILSRSMNHLSRKHGRVWNGRCREGCGKKAGERTHYTVASASLETKGRMDEAGIPAFYIIGTNTSSS